jgi:hypothetical protein
MARKEEEQPPAAPEGGAGPAPAAGVTRDEVVSLIREALEGHAPKPNDPGAGSAPAGRRSAAVVEQDIAAVVAEQVAKIREGERRAEQESATAAKLKELEKALKSKDKVTPAVPKSMKAISQKLWGDPA